MILEREHDPVVARGGTGLTEKAGDRTGRRAALGGPARHDAHHGESELRRRGEPGKEAVERLGALAEREPFERAPREPERDVAGLGEKGGRRERCRVAEEARLQKGEVELEPARLADDVERAAREHVQRRRLSAPDLSEQPVVGVAVDSDLGRHQGAFSSWTSSSLCAPASRVGGGSPTPPQDCHSAADSGAAGTSSRRSGATGAPVAART